MSIPLELPNGLIAVYGMGVKQSQSGLELINEQSDIRFAQVYQVYSGGAVFVYNGDYVMFKDADVFGRIKYNNYPYTIVPIRLVTKELPLL